MPVEHFSQDATELLSLANLGEASSLGEARSLSRLASLAVAQVPGCSAAHATIWRDGEMVTSAATHPDAAALADLEAAGADGPLATAAREGDSVRCPDTLDEDRWPQWQAAALTRGVRSSEHLVRHFPPMTLVLALFGVRPAVLDADAAPVAEMLAEFGTAALANTLAYGEAQRTATQLRDSVAARAVTDQAKGVLMHALGCSAEEALAIMRHESQQRHVKVTEVAARVLAAYGADEAKAAGGKPGAGRPGGAKSGPARPGAPRKQGAQRPRSHHAIARALP
ncbi:MAG TPA: ANTAR domain-containing protein [Trebonia sp.]|jgi:hypothetical protein|nr:ANTAR domain-containing protein [Trebonia sp.]